MKPIKVAVYVRVSRLDQNPENQLSELRRYVAARGWQGTEFVDAGISGSKDKRPQLDAMMKDVKRLIEPAAAHKDVALTLTGGSAIIKGDKEGLIEAFTNIVENAIKYNFPRGSVNISITEESGNALVTIQDTGIGIPKEEFDRIFDRFYRVDTSRGVTVGSGLGLSIVRTIIDAHGGHIELDSVVGSGSIFKVYLPLSTERRA